MHNILEGLWQEPGENPGRGRGGQPPGCLRHTVHPGDSEEPLTFYHPVGRRQLGINCLGLGHLQPPGDSDALFVRPTAHPDRTGGPDTQRRRRRRRAANRSVGDLVSELALKLLPSPRVPLPPPPPPPSLLLRRHRQSRRLCSGHACVVVIYLFPKHASRFFFYSWGRGMGRRSAHTSTHPGTETRHGGMEPHARTLPGLRPITRGGPGAREERQGRRCQCHQPRLGVPGGGEAPAVASAAAAAAAPAPAAASPHGAPPQVRGRRRCPAAARLCLPAPLLHSHRQSRGARQTQSQA